MPEILSPAGGISLRQLLDGARFFGTPDIQVRSVCHRWQDSQPGDLFVALCGDDEDTHEQAYQAVERGASFVLAERLLPLSVPMCVVPDTRIAHARLCMALAGRPDHSLTTIGITGTNGKTSTAILLAAVLEAAGRRTGMLNSLGYTDSVRVTRTQQATPKQPDLAYWLARMAHHGCTEAILEISSQALAQRYVAGTEFDAAVLTNLRRDHLDLHGNVANYHRAKSRLLDQLKTDGFVIANADDYAIRRLIKPLNGPVITYALHSEAEIMADVLERHVSEQTFLLHAGPETYPVRTGTIGDHHIYNCLAATAVGLLLGIDLPTIVRGLESVAALPGRLERIECGQPYGVFLDCAAKPDALAAGLKALRGVTSGRLICVYGATPETANEQRPWLGRVVERSCDLGVITDCGCGDALQVAHQILDGYDRPSRAHLLPGRPAAIRWVLDQAEAGDTILIAGHRPSSVRKGQDERELIRTHLYQQAREPDMAGRRRMVLPMVSPN